MKIRLVSLVALCLLSVSLVGMTQTSAEAAPFGARLSRTSPIVGEYVHVYGAVPPAKRPVGLQGYRGGRWVGLASTRTGSSGSYNFTVRATSAATLYRVYAPKAKIKHKKRPARVSNTVRVTGVRPSLSASIAAAPVGSTTLGNATVSQLATPGVASFRPARPGAVVTVQRKAGSSWTRVASGRQNSAGSYRFQVFAGSAGSPQIFRAVTSPGPGVSTVTSPWVNPTYYTNTFDDNFTDSTVSAQNWATRVQSPGGRRMCAQTDDALKTFDPSAGTVTLRAVKQSTNPQGTSMCPHGFWHNGMIGTAGAPNQLTFGPSGVYAARVKFQSANGSHGSFWMQGTDSNGKEIDVAEYFGDGRSDGGLSNFVHSNATGSTADSVGGVQRSALSILGKGKTPSNGWHVYSVEWSPTGYVFRLDGVPTFSTNRYVSTGPEELVLSLLTSDYELQYMKSSSASMQVDWVRAWQ